LIASLAVSTGCSGPKPVPAATPVQKLSAEGVHRLERGDYTGAAEMFKQTLHEAELVDDLRGQATAWNNIGSLGLAQGDLAVAVSALGHAVRFYRQIKEHGLGELRARVNLGIAQLASGDVAAARGQLTEAQRLGDSLGKPREAWLAEVTLGSADVKSGQASTGAERAQRALIWARSAHDLAIESAASLVLGSAFQAQGDLDGALSSYERALEIDRTRQEPSAILEDLRALADLYKQRGQLSLAGDVLARRGRVAKRLGRLDVAEADMAWALEFGAKEMHVDDVDALRIEYDAIRAVRGAAHPTAPERFPLKP
jgi:tetratricopeptide (TPR) repeat protein